MLGDVITNTGMKKFSVLLEEFKPLGTQFFHYLQIGHALLPCPAEVEIILNLTAWRQKPRWHISIIMRYLEYIKCSSHKHETLSGT